MVGIVTVRRPRLSTCNTAELRAPPRCKCIYRTAHTLPTCSRMATALCRVYMPQTYPLTTSLTHAGADRELDWGLADCVLVPMSTKIQYSLRCTQTTQAPSPSDRCVQLTTRPPADRSQPGPPKMYSKDSPSYPRDHGQSKGTIIFSHDHHPLPVWLSAAVSSPWPNRKCKQASIRCPRP